MSAPGSPVLYNDGLFNAGVFQGTSAIAEIKFTRRQAGLPKVVVRVPVYPEDPLDVEKQMKTGQTVSGAAMTAGKAWNDQGHLPADSDVPWTTWQGR